MLYSVCCATAEDDINWMPWLAVAHADPAKVDRLVIQKIYTEFKTANITKLDEDNPNFDQENNWLDDEGEQWNAFNAHLAGMGYSVFHPGSIAWLV